MVDGRRILTVTRMTVSSSYIFLSDADVLGFDDVIYPVDYRTAGHIVDDEMHDIMYVPLAYLRLCAELTSLGSGPSNRASA
jgi:hypothetical protein